MTVPIKLIVTDILWQHTISVLQQYSAKTLEAGCFWYGRRGEDASLGLVLGIPRQTNRPTNFEIAADDLAELTQEACTPGELVTVAQLHIHPGTDVRHSPWDDKQVVSRNIYSLVFPNYAKSPVVFDNVGVHRFENNHWCRLSTQAARNTVVITPSFVDKR